jgi:CheY-like chemotaxis protein
MEYKFESVLLIDDNELDNYVNKKIIEANRFSKRVYVNTSAQSALEFIHNMNAIGKDAMQLYPEVIFIDINMPVIDGFQFIEFFQKTADKNLRKPKLVILTSSIAAEDKLLAMEVTEDVLFLNKPLTKEHLKQIAETHLV